MTRVRLSTARLACVAACAALLLASAACAQRSSHAAPSSSPAIAYDLLVVNARIVDGTGNPWFYGDVAVRDGRIAAIGHLDGATADTIIDAGRRVLAPGFIDVHTHADTGLYRQPLAENFILDGVTTIVTGNCGGSVVDVAEYFDTLDRQGVALNVATLIGHNSILREVKGNRAGELTEEQWAEARRLIRKAMEDGAVGFSTGLIYTPGTYSDTEEVIEMQRVAAEYGAIYVTHMRDEATRIVAAIEEAIRIARETDSRLQISHFKMPADVAETMGGSRVTLAMVDAARDAGLEVWVDQYPYTASSTGMSTLLPGWVLEDSSKVNDILSDEAQVAKVLEDMRQSHEVRRRRRDMSFAVVASSRAYPEFAGLNVKEVAQVLKMRAERGDDVDWRAIAREQWPEVTSEEQYRAVIDMQLKGGASGVFHTMPEAEVVNIMRHPLVAVASDSGVRRFGEGNPHPRGYGTNARVLGRYVREQGHLKLEDAIRKMTSLPALAFRFDDRGVIREGYRADLVLFDPERVIDRATFEQPHQYAEGFDYVIVNGVPVVARGEITGALPGQVVHGPGRK